MVVSDDGTTMVEYTWRKGKASDRLLLWSARIATRGTIRLKKIVVMIRAGWS